MKTYFYHIISFRFSERNMSNLQRRGKCYKTREAGYFNVFRGNSTDGKGNKYIYRGNRN